VRQLSLFKSRRQRGIKAPPPLEFHVHAALADICKRWLNPEWRFTHLPFGEFRGYSLDPKTGKRWSAAGMRLQRMGVQAGWPDFMFVGPKASMFWLELKRQGKGRVSEAQLAIFEHLALCGFPVLVTSSLDEAVAELKARGILRSNFEVQ
jgi:hypothetical protein